VERDEIIALTKKKAASYRMRAVRLIVILLSSLLYLTSVEAESQSLSSQAKQSLLISATDQQITETQHQETKLHLRRRLLGNYYDLDFGDVDWTSAEGGFAAGFFFFLILLVLLCCCLCGRGRGCSLWDILACICIWELCCDDRAIDGFDMMPA